MNGIPSITSGAASSKLTGEGAIQYGSPAADQLAGGAPEPIFSPSDLEQLCFRRYNPFSQLNAQNLASALDQFDAGVLMWAARFWQQIVNRDDTIPAVKSKREEAVALRPVVFNPLEDTDEAKDQAAALEKFYRNVKAGHSLNRHTTGGLSLLITQMMESVAFLYAIHHIVWTPDAATQWKLPSGKTVPALKALFEQVPLEFFEARTGELRFLGLSQGYTGEQLAPDNWLVTTGPGLMRAASSLFYFKRLANHDLVNFSEKFGTPGIEVETTGGKDSEQGAAARDLARQLAANWRGVRYGSDKNAVNFLWPQGGVSGTELPMHTISEDAKRSLAILWLGEDLSTMSRGGNEKAVGSNAQEDEREKRERHDCARISETLQTIDAIVIRWFFGEDAPILAQTVVEMPINEDRKQLLDLVTGVVNLGGEVPISPVMKRLALPEAKENEAIFHPSQPAPPDDPESDDEEEDDEVDGAQDSAVNAITPARLLELAQMPSEEFETALSALAVNGGPGSGPRPKGVLRETLVPTHHQIFSLIGIKPGKVFADYEALRQKHPDQFADSHAVKVHVEKVMAEPHLILPGSEDDHRMIVHQATDGDRASILEVQERGGKYRVRSAYTLTAGQLATKIKKAGGEGAQSPFLRVDHLSAKHLQGAGVPSDTLPTGKSNLDSNAT
jgi:phage gp29-like protein